MRFIDKGDAELVAYEEKKYEEKLAPYLDKKEALEAKYFRNEYDTIIKKGNPNGIKITGKDIKYYAKIEYQRYYSYLDANEEFSKVFKHNNEVQKEINGLKKCIVENNKLGKESLNKELEKKIENLDKFGYQRDRYGVIIKDGAVRKDNQMHAHIIVHRYDKDKELKLSPMANHRGGTHKLDGKEVRGGFDRNNFRVRCEGTFDKKFGYNRSLDKSLKGRQLQRNLSKGNQALMLLSNPKQFAINQAKKAVAEIITGQVMKSRLSGQDLKNSYKIEAEVRQQSREVLKMMGYSRAIKNPTEFPKKLQNELEKKATEAIAKKIGEDVSKFAGAAQLSTPVSTAVKIAKDVIKMVAKQMSQGMGI